MSPFQIAESSDISRISSEQFVGVKNDLLGPLISCDESITHHVSNVSNTKKHIRMQKDICWMPQNSQDHQLHPLKKNLSSIYRYRISGGLQLPNTSSGPKLTSPRGLVLDKDRYPLRSVGKPPSSCSHFDFRWNPQAVVQQKSQVIWREGGDRTCWYIDRWRENQSSVNIFEKNGGREKCGVILSFCFCLYPISWCQDTLVYRCFTPESSGVIKCPEGFLQIINTLYIHIGISIGLYDHAWIV